VSFDANYRAATIVRAALAADFNAHLADVCAERGITVPAVHHIYEGKGARYELPAHDLQPPRLDIDDDSSGEIETAVEMWVLTTSTALDAEVLSRNSAAYLTALVRTFAGRDGADYHISVPEADTSPPGATGQEGTSIQASGVKLRVRMAESA
jgi:hypothetical protein